MTISDALENWDGLTTQKKRQILQAVINFIDYDTATNEDNDLMYDMLCVAAGYESDDYFGTEGLRV